MTFTLPEKLVLCALVFACAYCMGWAYELSWSGQ